MFISKYIQSDATFITYDNKFKINLILICRILILLFVHIIRLNYTNKVERIVI